MAELRLNLLGKPEIWLDGTPFSGFSTVKTEALLYYLAVTGRAHSRDSLASLFWGDMLETNAKRNLTKALSDLRKELDPFLLIEPRNVSLNHDGSITLDIIEFETAQDLTATIDLYRGDFLEGLYVKDALEFEEWVVVERERLRERMLATLESMVNQLTARGAAQSAHIDAGKYARRLLELDPWRESAHRQLMVLLARRGQYAAAITQYDKCKQILLDELGVEPMPETTALYERILAARRTQLPPLPAETEPFIGRTAERARLHEMLSDPKCRLVTVIGLGGVGKTRLSLAAAREINREGALNFINGVVFIPLADVPGLADLVPAITHRLDIPLPGHGDSARALTNYLRNKEILLVLDNFEHLTEGAGVLTQILSEAPHIKILVTSREPLRLTAEWRLNLEGMAIPEAVSLDELAQVEAIQLFLQTAQQVFPGYKLTSDDLPHVVELCRLVAGMPLAIKLAAARIRGVPIEQIVVEVQRNLDILATQMRDLPPRQRSIRASFAYTWELMTEEERAVNSALSVFRGGFSAQAARQIANADNLTLAGLIECGVVLTNRTPDEIRYTLHSLARQFGAEKLTDQGSAGQIALRHAEYFADLVAAQYPALTSSDHRDSVQLFRQEWDNVGRAWDTAIEHSRVDLLEKMLEPVGIFCQSGAYMQESLALYGKAAELLETPENQRAYPQVLGAVWGWLGRMHFNLVTGAEGETYHHRQLTLAHRVNDPLNEAYARVGLARYATDHSKWDEVITHADAALKIFTQLNHVQGQILAMTALGIGYQSPEGSKNWYLRAVEMGREAGDIRAYLLPLVNLGYLATDVGQYAEAKAYFDEAETLYEQTGSHQTGRLFYLRGRLAAFMGDYEEAMHYFEKARAVRVEEGSPYNIAQAERWLGRMYQLMGDVHTGRRIIQRSLDTFIEKEHSSSIQIALSHLGLAEEAAGNLDLARQYFSQAIDIARDLNRRGDIAFNHANRTRVLLRQGDLDTARAGLLEAYAVLDPDVDPRSALNLLASTAAYWIALDKPEDVLPALFFIIQHPVATRETKDRVQKLLDEVVVEATPQMVRQKQEEVERATLKELIEQFHTKLS